MGDPNLKSTWGHRAWFTIGCTTVLLSLANAISGSINSYTWLQTILAGFIGYLLADLCTGVYHWAIDNYGDASTPIFGSQIVEFQGHHKFPSAITKREIANNLYMLARVITYMVLPINLIFHHQPVMMVFIGILSGCILFSQQFHAWAHETKSKLPSIVVALQDVGVLLSRSQHAAHHRRPYNNNYCILSGVWNRFLDKHRVFEGMEMMVFLMLGLRPRSWSESNSNNREEVEVS